MQNGHQIIPEVVPLPSSGVSSFAGMEQIIRTTQNKFHARQPAGNFGPPVSLFHPAWACLTITCTT